MSIWESSYDAKEVHGSRVERWSDKVPSVTVELQVFSSDVYNIVDAIVRQRPDWPYNDTSPYELAAMDVEILPIRSGYVADRGTDESITTGNDRVIRVTYRPNTAFQHTVVTTVGTGTATDYGFETQTVWVEVTRTVETEFLTQDFNDFQWENGDPLKEDEAPGKIFRTVKYEVEYRNIFLTQDLEWIIYNYSNTVNDSSLSTVYGLINFEQDQVLFTVEDVKPSLRYDRSTLGFSPLPDGLILHNLKCSFHCRQGEATWNKFFRAKTDTAGAQDDSGWYEMAHKQTVPGQATNVTYQPFPRTEFWYPLWPTG